MDISKQQMGSLFHMCKDNGRPMSYYSEKMMIPKSNLTVVSDKLIKEGYVDREFDPSDRRIIILNITEKGKAYLEEQKKKSAEYIEELKDLYFEQIDKNADYVQVVSVINCIVFKKFVDPRYMIFAIKYLIKKHARIKSPYSLHYLPNNKTIQNLWKKEVSNPDNR
jgi:DNA-binding MarR family transcriptional regulator